jgi:nitroreductase
LEPDKSTGVDALSALMRSRVMCRAFLSDEVDDDIVCEIVDLGTRAPSAGRSQGLHIVELTGADREKLWSTSLPGERRDAFAFQGLLRAPVLLTLFVDPGAYVERYAEQDKAHTGLGAGKEMWRTPFWFVDAGMLAMSMLLAAQAHGLGALFFALPHPEDEIRFLLGVPDHLETVGVMALGYRDLSDPQAHGAGRSATRPRRTAEDVIHRGQWTSPEA